MTGEWLIKWTLFWAGIGGLIGFGVSALYLALVLIRRVVL